MRTHVGGKLQRDSQSLKEELPTIWQWKQPENQCTAAAQINTKLTRILPLLLRLLLTTTHVCSHFPNMANHDIYHIFLHVWLREDSVSAHVWTDCYINKRFLLACLSDFVDPDVLSCLDYRYLYNHCPGPEWNVMCRGCCEYDVIRCKCPLQGTPVGYAVPCCRNAINECDPCIIHPGSTSANIHIGIRSSVWWDVANFLTLNRIKGWLSILFINLTAVGSRQPINLLETGLPLIPAM